MMLVELDHEHPPATVVCPNCPRDRRGRLDLAPARAGGLTERQVAVLELVAEGHTNAAIGRRLDLAENTVKSHVRAACRRLRANGRPNVVFLALRKGAIR